MADTTASTCSIDVARRRADAGVDFSVADKTPPRALVGKHRSSRRLAGHPTDAFSVIRRNNWRSSRPSGTRRPGRSVETTGLAALFDADPSAVCMVGKTRNYHVDVALEFTRGKRGDDFRLHRLRQQRVGEVLLCEHFFDGHKASPEYALSCVKAAYGAGARWVVLVTQTAVRCRTRSTG